MFVEWICSVNIVSETICCGKNEVPIRQVHGCSLLAKPNVKCVSLVSRVMCDSCRIHAVGSEIEVSVDRLFLAGRLKGDEGGAAPIDGSGDIPNFDGLLRGGGLGSRLQSAEVDHRARAARMGRERMCFRGECCSKEAWSNCFEGKLETCVSISGFELDVGSAMLCASDMPIYLNGYVLLRCILVLRHLEGLKYSEV